VWCERLSDNGDPDPFGVQITYGCSGADACAGASCTPDQWSFITNVTLPGSFFLPPLGAAQASSANPPSASPAGASPSGVQITPDSKRTLISKDVGDERWAITSNGDDSTVTGNVFRSSGGDPQFVWCQRVSDNGDPNPETVLITFSCSGADRCNASPCSAGDWSFISDVTLPGSFFLPG
jgi:hypothetical protein